MVTHLSTYTRVTNSSPRVRTIGLADGKTQWMDHDFVNPTAMFIFDGHGSLRFEGREHTLRAPFVLLARPGRRYEYGPTAAWDECFVIYDGTSPALPLASLPAEPWLLRGGPAVRDHWAALRRLVTHAAVKGVADEIDALAQLMLLTSFYGTGEEVEEGPLRRLYATERWLRTHFRENLNLDRVAARFGFSQVTFRRWWRSEFDTAPWQYVLRLRMQEAQHLLLTERGLTIGQVATRCGFPDQRYFATAFRQHTGQTPSAYRASGSHA